MELESRPTGNRYSSGALRNTPRVFDDKVLSCARDLESGGGLGAAHVNAGLCDLAGEVEGVPGVAELLKGDTAEVEGRRAEEAAARDKADSWCQVSEKGGRRRRRLANNAKWPSFFCPVLTFLTWLFTPRDLLPQCTLPLSGRPGTSTQTYSDRCMKLGRRRERTFNEREFSGGCRVLFAEGGGG